MDLSNYIHTFKESVEGIEIPHRFTFPFYYAPHKLTNLAASQLQSYLLDQDDWEHNFGLKPDQKGMVIGKMFGVMVVRTPEGDLGFLAAYSGKLADSNDIPGFVPPVFDMLDKDGYYKREEARIDELNRDISLLEQNKEYVMLQNAISQAQLERDQELEVLRNEFNASRKKRRVERKLAAGLLSEQQLSELHENHKRISLEKQYQIKRISGAWGEAISKLQAQADQYNSKIRELKMKRKKMSNDLQRWLFDQYNFQNANGELKNVVDIFKTTALGSPPAGAGECAAPKLLQFAYQNDLQPVCFGEFWWGQPPKSEVRKHGTFYPSCKGKCEPILSHMLIGLDVDENPMEQTDETKEIKIIYEDNDILIINKPEELLSVPGRSVNDSVYMRFRHKIRDKGSPLIVHRLDMSTSGLMVLAKTKDSHASLQKQFLNRTVKKKYIADLDGILMQSAGEINLPLKLDYINRPQQCVCYEEGKPAKTLWRLLSVTNGISRVEFQPVTGRTHQLRVHAAHVDGLNMPILGDDLYGEVYDRLHLHAAYLEIQHPVSKEQMVFTCDPQF